MLFYHIGSCVKIVFGLGLLLLVYTSISPQQDPLVALGLLFVGVFLFARGASFYAFYGYQRFVQQVDTPGLASQSYKLSLLFGLFALLNIVLIFSNLWNKVVGVVLLVLFVLLQMMLTQSEQTSSHVQHQEKY